MNTTGRAYSYICRSSLTAFIILLLTILSFGAADSNRHIQSLIGTETLSYQYQDDIGNEITDSSPSAHLHLLARGKVKVKIFLKKYLSSPLQEIQSVFAYKSMHYTSQTRSALKPEYYCFLFRYKPF